MRSKISFAQDLSTYSLPINEYHNLYHYLLEDNSLEIEKLLKSDQSEIVLNGRFVYNKEPSFLLISRSDKRPRFELTRPLCLAVAFNAHKTISLLHNHGIDMLVKDVNGKFVIRICLTFDFVIRMRLLSITD